MPVRPLRSLAAVLVSVAILTGCTADAEPASTAEKVTGAVPLASGVVDLPGKVTDTKVTASPDLREKPTTYLGAMHEAAAIDGNTTLPIRDNAAALITAFDDEQNVLARTVTVRLDGFDATGEVHLDYTSTAFTRLLTLPTFVTDNPLAVLVLRGAAEQSPNLSRLASAIEANAATNPTFEANPTAAENKALAGLSRDVRATLATIADEVSPAPAGAARTAPAWAMKNSATSTAAFAEEVDCLPILSDTGLYTPYVEDTSTFCAKPAPGDDDTFTIDLSNDAAVWGLIYAHDGNKKTGPRLAGMVNPYAFVIPDLDTIVSALLHAVSKERVAIAVGVVCEGASWLGIECPEQWAETFNPEEFFQNIAKELALSKRGEATIALTAAEARNELAILTPGIANGPIGHYPSRYNGIDNEATQAAMAVGSVYTSLVEPMLGLLFGDSIRDLDSGTHRSDGDASIERCEYSPKHKADPSCGGNSELVEALLIATAKSGDIATATTALLNAVSEGDLNEALPALANFALKIISDKNVMAALIGDVAEGVVADVLQSTLTRLGVAAVPGLGWLKTAHDIGLPILNATIGLWNMFQGFTKTARATYLYAANPDEARILADYDWAGPDYTYEGYFNDGNGEGFLPFNLLSDGETSPSMPGVSDTRFVGATYGTIDDESVALVAIQMMPEGPLESTGPYLTVHLIKVDPKTRKPMTTALFTDYPTYDFASKAVYAVEDNTVVAYYTYLTGSSGAAQDDGRKTYRLLTDADLPDPDDPSDDTEFVLPSVGTLVLDETTFVPPAQSREGITWENTFVPDI
jgi:hypothetical protein